MNVFIWVLERALHNDAFAAHATQIKEYKYKANKLKMAYAPKSHYAKNTSINGNINKPRWSTTIKHKPNNPPEGQKTPHRKSSLQYFTSPMQPSQSSQQQPQPQQQSQQQNSSSSHTHLQAIPHQYYGGHGHNPNAGTGHNNNYNKSSSYPNFASNLSSGGGGGGSGSNIKHHVQHLQQQSQGQHPLQQQPQPQPQQTHHTQQQQQQQPHVPHGNFMYHRHSLNNISAHQHQQQFLQQLQQQQQQQQQPPLLPSIFLTAMSGGGGGPLSASKGKSQPTDGGAGSIAATSDPVSVPKSSPVDLLGSKSQNNSIGDINSRLEFLCLQMTEQAIN